LDSAWLVKVDDNHAYSKVTNFASYDEKHTSLNVEKVLRLFKSHP